MRRAVILTLALAAWAALAPAQAQAQSLDSVPRPPARAGATVQATVQAAASDVAAQTVAPAIGLRPMPRTFHVLVTGARATGQRLAPPEPVPLLPLPLTTPQAAAVAPGPLLPVWPGIGPDGIAPGPLAVLAPLAEPVGQLAAQEERLRRGGAVSVDVGRLSRLFAAAQFSPLRLTRPAAVVPDAAMQPPETLVNAMAQPDVRPQPRPGSLAPTGDGAPSAALPPDGRPETRPQARPDWPERAQVVPLADSVPGPYAAFSAPVTSPQATAVALRPPVRPEGITQAFQAARAERVRGSVCGDPSIQGQVIEPVGSGGCRLSDPVRITSVSGVALSTPSIMDCTTAQTLNRWVERGARPAVGNIGGGIASLQVMGSYSCRTRNNQPGARLSEHAKGRAVDIGAIVLQNGNRLSVLRDWGNGAGGEALRQMHRAACGMFGTVLGPNANAAHRDHFHFDTARYRTGSYCR